MNDKNSHDSRRLYKRNTDLSLRQLTKVLKYSKSSKSNLLIENLLNKKIEAINEPKPQTKQEITTIENKIWLNQGDSLKDFLDKEAIILESYYFSLSLELRDKLLSSLSQKESDLFAFLAHDEHMNKIKTPLEYLYLIQNHLNKNNVNFAVDCFLNHQDKLLFLLERNQYLFAESFESIAFKLGCALQEASYLDFSQKVFRTLKESSSYYEKALLKTLKADKDNLGIDIEKRWKEEKDIDKKFLDLTFYLKKSIENTNTSIQLRSQLKPLLKKIYEFFPEKPNTYRKLSITLRKASGHFHLLPFLLDGLKDLSLVFKEPTLEEAIWDTFLDRRLLNSDRVEQIAISALANFHIAILKESVDEHNIWQVKQKLEDKDVKNYLGFSYDSLVSKLLDHLDSSKQQSYRKKEYLRAFLSLTLELPLSETHLKKYIEFTKKPSSLTLEKCLRMSQTRHSFSLEENIWNLILKVKTLTNKDLLRMFYVFSKQCKPDTCWRIATILVFRNADYNNLLKAWKNSPENRNHFSLCIPEPNSFVKSITSSNKEYLVFQKLLEVGPLLEELFPYKVRKPVHSPDLTLEKSNYDNELLEKFNTYFFKTYGKKMESNSVILQKDIEIHQLPETTRALPRNQWLHTFIRVSQFYGLIYLNWNLGNFLDITSHIKENQFGDSDANSRFYFNTKLFANLKAYQREALRKLIDLTYSLPIHEKKSLLLRFANVCTTLIYPNHIMALNTAAQMGQTLDQTRHLEKFLISSEYSQLRRYYNIENQNVIPTSLLSSFSLSNFNTD